MGRANDILKKLGPGLLFAGAAIGVSHLVQSTKAGADFGLGLVWALIIANIFKYPFFQYGPKYALSSGESVLHGYKKLSRNILIIYFILTIATMFSIQTAVTIVTAGIAKSMSGGLLSIEVWTVLITIFCSLILIIGKYKTLDKRKKIYKAVQKFGLIFDSKKLYENQISNWISDQLKSCGYTIDF